MQAEKRDQQAQSFTRNFNVDYTSTPMTTPRIVMITMIIFLIIVAFLTAILSRQIHTFFITNPGLNGLILGVLLAGILLTFGQVIRLMPEIRWVNSLRRGDDGSTSRPPVLLAPMRTLLSHQQSVALSATSMRSILDSIATRLDESRDISRYFIGLLVFLGLLGTFWGLLETIGSIGNTIQTLDPASGSTSDVLDALKAGLQAPLSGMGTAFSSSLFGLSGSLILGFLDLQAGRAQNRFYTELENWLSSVTDFGSDLKQNIVHTHGSNDEIRDIVNRLQSLQENGNPNQRTTAALANLAEGIHALVKNMRSEQQMMRDWAERQAEDQQAMRTTLDKLNKALNDANRDPSNEPYSGGSR